MLCFAAAPALCSRLITDVYSQVKKIAKGSFKHHLSIHHLIDAVWIHTSPPEPASVALSVTWCALLRPSGRFAFGLLPETTASQVGQWTHPAPSQGCHIGSGQTKPSDSFIPSGESLLSLCFSPSYENKSFSVADDWGARLLCVSCVIHRQSDNAFSLLLSVHLVLSWQHSSSDISSLSLFLHCFFFYCLWSILQMNVYCPPYRKWKNDLFALFCNSFWW